MTSSGLDEANGAAINQKETLRESKDNGKSDPSQYVKLNVGGQLFYTTIDTLTKVPDTMLSAMFSGRMAVLTDSDGWVLIDRCGNHFAAILNYLRDGTMPVFDSHKEISELLSEAQYYCITELIAHCERAMVQHQAECRVPLITTAEEGQLLLSKTTVPAVIFVVQYPEPHQSHNVLLNTKLFDELAMRFKGRILFIKDISAGKTMSWTFYNRGIQVAKLNCNDRNAIVFPEKQILQELLNIYDGHVSHPTFTQELSSVFASVSIGWLIACVLGGILCRRWFFS